MSFLAKSITNLRSGVRGVATAEILKINFREIFRVARISTFATISAKRRHGIASANEKRPPQLAASFPILELTWARLCTQMAGYIENAETPETA